MLDSRPARDPAPAPDPKSLIMGMARDWWRFAALVAWVDLGCPDQLKSAPLTTAELAERCEADPPSLARLQRTMASLGFVSTTPSGHHSLTPAGLALAEDTAGSMRATVRAMGEPVSWAAMGELAEVVRTGRSPISTAHGSLYGYYAANPGAGAEFEKHMTARSRDFADALLAAYDFTGTRTVTDVGGGNGTIIAAVLKAWPHLTGTLLELAHVLPGARAYLGEHGLAERCTAEAGDFFSSVKAGADVYLLANIVHNWGDADALRLLGNVADAVASGGRVLLLDYLLPDLPDAPHPGFDLDIRMLALFGDGRERTRSEYLDLLRAAGLTPVEVRELPNGACLVEAVPSSQHSTG